MGFRGNQGALGPYDRGPAWSTGCVLEQGLVTCLQKDSRAACELSATALDSIIQHQSKPKLSLSMPSGCPQTGLMLVLVEVARPKLSHAFTINTPVGCSIMRFCSVLACALLGGTSTSYGVQAYTRCAQLEPENGDAWNNLAAVHLQGERWLEAYSALGEAIKLKRGSWQTWSNYALAAMRTDHPVQACRGILQVSMPLAHHTVPQCFFANSASTLMVS